MKVYIQGIIFGILSVISGLMMSGIPLGSEMIEIANLFILVIGVFAVFFVGVFKKKYNVAAIVSAIYLGALFSLTMIIETNMSGFAIAGIGFVPGLSLAVTGLITSIQQKGNRKIRTGIIFNSIGMLINIASLVLAVMNGFVVS